MARQTFLEPAEDDFFAALHDGDILAHGRYSDHHLHSGHADEGTQQTYENHSERRTEIPSEFWRREGMNWNQSCARSPVGEYNDIILNREDVLAVWPLDAAQYGEDPESEKEDQAKQPGKKRGRKERYVQWLAPQIDALKQTMPERLRELRAAARKEPVHHDRTPDIVASLAVGLEMFLRFACEAGAIKDGQRMSLWQQGWQTLLEAAEAQAGHQTDEEPTARFLALLGSAITSGQAYVAAATDGGQPADAGNWGWRRRAYLSGQVEQEEWQPKGALVGWLDGDDLLLDPEGAYAVVQRLARDQGSGVLIGAKTLWKRMAEQGKLGSRDDARSRNMVRRMIHGRRRTVIHIFSDGPLSPRIDPIGPIGPDPSVSAASGAENMGRLFEDGGKPAHETGPKPQENRDAGTIGPVGPQIEHKPQPSDESFSEGSSPGDEPETPAPTTGNWQERI